MPRIRWATATGCRAVAALLFRPEHDAGGRRRAAQRCPSRVALHTAAPSTRPPSPACAGPPSWPKRTGRSVVSAPWSARRSPRPGRAGPAARHGGRREAAAARRRPLAQRCGPPVVAAAFSAKASTSASRNRWLAVVPGRWIRVALTQSAVQHSAGRRLPDRQDASRRAHDGGPSRRTARLHRAAADSAHRGQPVLAGFGPLLPYAHRRVFGLPRH
jgi:hypothetical protein